MKIPMGISVPLIRAPHLRGKRLSIQERARLKNQQLEEGFNMNRVKQLDKEIRSTHQPQTKQRSRGLSR